MCIICILFSASTVERQYKVLINKKTNNFSVFLDFFFPFFFFCQYRRLTFQASYLQTKTTIHMSTIQSMSTSVTELISTTQASKPFFHHQRAAEQNYQSVFLERVATS